MKKQYIQPQTENIATEIAVAIMENSGRIRGADVMGNTSSTFDEEEDLHGRPGNLWDEDED